MEKPQAQWNNQGEEGQWIIFRKTLTTFKSNNNKIHKQNENQAEIMLYGALWINYTENAQAQWQQTSWGESINNLQENINYVYKKTPAQREEPRGNNALWINYTENPKAQ